MPEDGPVCRGSRQ